MASTESDIPFSIYRNLGGCVEPIADICNFPPSTEAHTERQRANAALIVEAVNSHASLVSRVTELEAGLSEMEEAWKADLKQWGEEQKERNDRIGLLEKALATYGNHMKSCPVYQNWRTRNPSTGLWEDKPCDCGFTEALEAKAALENK
jgi:hypothetical protein